MPKIDFINSKNEKKLIITEFCKEFLEENETEIWITIKKMPLSVKQDLHLLTIESLTGKMGKELIKKIRKDGKNIQDIDKLDENEKLDFFINLEIDFQERKLLNNYSYDIEKLIIENCIDPKKHNFFDNNGNVLDISNFEFWEILGKDKLMNYIIAEIKEFSKDFFFN